MSEDLRNTWHHFIRLVYKIFFDALAAIFIVLVAHGLKFVFENWIYHKKLSEINGVAPIVFNVSEYVAMIMYFIFVAVHIYGEVKILVKESNE
jgi:hypothetical protein